MNQLSEAAREIARRAAKNLTDVVEDATGYVTDAAKDAAMRAPDAAKNMYQSATRKAGETLAVSKEYVRRNPLPVVLGAVAFGVALGYMLMMARRKPTFGEQYVDEPLGAVREVILGALAPVTQRVHKGFDSARDGADKAMDRVHSFGSARSGNSLSHQIGRIGNNLKFW